MRYLLISLLFVFSACSSSYKHLQTTAGDVHCLDKFKPDFSNVLYYTQVNVIGKHLSGLLLIKAMPDSSTRIVFSSEAGFKFFDFGFAPNGNFKVYYIIDEMDKKAVITTLRKDFEMVMMQPYSLQNGYVRKDIDSAYNYYTFPQEKGFNYYITDAGCNELIRLERASKRKAVVKIQMLDYKNGTPDSIGITHTNFNFNIGLKRLEKIAG
ncbi:hypothetical protein [Parafilimonas terrae]|jgi:hypothetical protein|uniref:Lipoprotein n=1 Tax=Parafilimonas terrae TaxID=1465490 RepID=A0A1I5U9W2_9BACT|nr:hypothetical protein [Parafilimonas terrae]SFP92073.1 hypothetical protein SAMN05444277_103161 [Parafilimonas terrae]